MTKKITFLFYQEYNTSSKLYNKKYQSVKKKHFTKFKLIKIIYIHIIKVINNHNEL